MPRILSSDGTGSPATLDRRTPLIQLFSADMKNDKVYYITPQFAVIGVRETYLEMLSGEDTVELRVPFNRKKLQFGARYSYVLASTLCFRYFRNDDNRSEQLIYNFLSHLFKVE